MPNALVTGADRGLGFGIANALLERGWTVAAGQFLPDWGELANLRERHQGALTIVPLDVSSIESCRAAASEISARGVGLDMLVANAGILGRDLDRTIADGLNYDEMIAEFNINSLGPMRTVEAFLPMMSAGGLKRLSFISSEAGSIGASYRKSWFGYCMSKAAVNMGITILFNDLRPRGFTFRVYHPGWIKSYMHGAKNEAATYTPEEGGRMAADYFCSDVDEDRLCLRTFDGKEMPW